IAGNHPIRSSLDKLTRGCAECRRVERQTERYFTIGQSLLPGYKLVTTLKQFLSSSTRIMLLCPHCRTTYSSNQYKVVNLQCPAKRHQHRCWHVRARNVPARRKQATARGRVSHRQ